MKRAIFALVMILCLAAVSAQNTPTINGLNQAQIIYRDVPDSLRIYFKDSFAFNLGYRNFAFGMKYIAELPKYQNSQSDLIDELAPAKLEQGFKELYLSYEKGGWNLRGGTLYETFGSGLIFRSYEDTEFDLDHRLDGFSFKYDDLFRLKAIYGANASPVNDKALDLAYGVDLEYPLPYVSLAAAAVGYRNLTPLGNYSQTELYSGRMSLAYKILNLKGEYAWRQLYKRGASFPEALNGSAIYLNGDLTLGSHMFGAAFKHYDQFQFRQQDVPLANYHGETLSDSQASALDEIGLQGWANISLPLEMSLELNYAEAWNKDESKHMNDGYAALSFAIDKVDAEISWSHVEKTGSDLNHLNQDIHYWQREITPAMHLNFPAWGKTLGVTSEFKLVDKEKLDAPSNSYVIYGHYEPRLQLDIALGAHALSLGVQSQWEDFGAIADSRYWANAEAKIALFDHSELLVFVGREAGGKVCRNGMCRFVAPFSGVRLELATRF